MVLGTIIKTIIGAVLGAIFGFIVGWIVELFPRFNAALLDGLHAITGINGIRTAALLAAVGFIVGIIAGVASGFRKRWYE
jgi:ABC-type dipeptide/oligopeptide/nickel transport system permease subunit